MVTKKKKVAPKKQEPLAPEAHEVKVETGQPPVRQVVEVVEEDGTTKTALEEIKEDAQHIEESVGKLEEEGLREEVAEEPTPTEAPTPPGVAEDEKSREETVKELFGGESQPITPEITKHTKNRTMPLYLWAGIVVAVALLTGGILLVATGRVKLPSFVSKPTPTPTSSPSPTPTITAVSRAEIKVQVINGGGVAGAAGKMKRFLEKKGWTVVAVGNADAYTYEETEILVKSGKETYRSLLEQDLKEDYVLGTASASLPQDSPYDVQVIVGEE